MRTGTNSTAGARGLTVKFPASVPVWGAGATGAVLFATTAEASGNRIIKVVDNGTASSAVTLITVSSSQMLAGLRFGPIATAAAFAANPTNDAVLSGGDASFSVGLSGRDGPFFYQWYFQSNCSGAFSLISNATNATLLLTNVSNVNVGCYKVVASNLVGSATSSVATLSLLSPPYFTATSFIPGNGFQMNFIGPLGYGYTIRYAPSPAITPVSSWNVLTTGTFSGGTDTYTDPGASANPQYYYIITVP